MNLFDSILPERRIVIFPSKRPPTQALERMRSTIDFKFRMKIREGVCGRVASNSIRVWCEHLAKHTPFYPIFVGKFVEHEGRTELQGRFWPAIPVPQLAIIVTLAISAALHAFTNQEEAGSLIISFILLVAGFALWRLGALLGADDRETISQTIREALV